MHCAFLMSAFFLTLRPSALAAIHQLQKILDIKPLHSHIFTGFEGTFLLALLCQSGLWLTSPKNTTPDSTFSTLHTNRGPLQQAATSPTS